MLRAFFSFFVFVIFWFGILVLNLLGIVDVPRLYITLPAAAATIALHRTRYDGLMILTTACALVVWVIVEFLNSLGVINIPNLVAAIIAFVIGGLVYYILGFLGRDAEKPGTELDRPVE